METLATMSYIEMTYICATCEDKDPEACKQARKSGVCNLIKKETTTT